MCPHVSFKGDCEEAFRFYEQALGGKIQYISYYKDTPMGAQVPAEFGGKVIHATMTLGDQRLMGSDAHGEHYKPIQGVSLTLETTDPAESERLFNALSEGGQVRMPFQKTYWTPGFGMVVDKFGIPWMVNTASQQPA